MDKLYPIVRRTRRPLLPEDEPQRRGDAEVKPAAEKLEVSPVSSTAAPEVDQPENLVVPPPITNKEADAPVSSSPTPAE